MKYRTVVSKEDFALSKEVHAHRFNPAHPYEGAKLGWVSRKTGKPLKSEPKNPGKAERIHIFSGKPVRDGDYIIVEQDMTSYVVTADVFHSQYSVA